LPEFGLVLGGGANIYLVNKKRHQKKRGIPMRSIPVAPTILSLEPTYILFEACYSCSIATKGRQDGFARNRK
jgi:hypothetical protein